MNAPSYAESAHLERERRLAAAWCALVSAKAADAGWTPGLALQSPAGLRAFNSLTTKQFCCGLTWRARTSRPNAATHAAVRAHLLVLLPPISRREFEPTLLTVELQEQLEELERAKRAAGRGGGL